jgi:hypothetical protein
MVVEPLNDDGDIRAGILAGLAGVGDSVDAYYIRDSALLSSKKVTQDIVKAATKRQRYMLIPWAVRL